MAYPFDDNKDESLSALDAAMALRQDKEVEAKQAYDAALKMSPLQKIGLALAVAGGPENVQRIQQMQQAKAQQAYNQTLDPAKNYVNDAVLRSKLERDAYEQKLMDEKNAKAAALLDPSSEENISKLKQLGEVYKMDVSNLLGKITPKEFEDYRDRQFKEKDLAQREAERKDRQAENLALRRESFETRKGELDQKRKEGALDVFEKDKLVSKLRDQGASAERAKEMLALARTNPIAAEAAKSMMARASGEVGAMTDQDIARFGGSKSFQARAQQTLEQLNTGRLTPENQAFLSEVADRMSKNAMDQLHIRGRQIAKSRSSASGIPESELLNMYGIPAEKKPISEKDIDNMSMEELKAAGLLD